MTQSDLPGSQWLGWMRNPALRLGVLTGVYLTGIMWISLLLANRLPALETFATVRNALCLAVFALATLLPLRLCRESATKLFVAGTTGWLMFSLMYWLTGFVFIRLHDRFHRPLQVFLIGAILYGLTAVALWVVEMVRHARTQPIAASRRRPY